MATQCKIFKRGTELAVCIFALALASSTAPAHAAASSPATAPAASPAVLAAFKDLSADDFQTRQKALAKLQQALGEQMRSLVASSDDPEVQSRVAQLLEFNDGLMRWALDTLKLPPDQRKAQLNFGLSPEVLPIMAKTFSQDVDTRVQGVKALAKLTSEDATALLARLLDDSNRAVHVAAMEAVWDRKPTAAVVASLWNRAVVEGFAGSGAGNWNADAEADQKITFRGQPLGVAYRNRYFQPADADIACDVLINLKAPQMAEKFQALPDILQKAEEINPWAINGNTGQMKNIFRLVEAYKSKEAIAALYPLATGSVRQHSIGQINGEQFAWTNRTGALATIIEATDQKPEDYKLKRSPMMGGIWAAATEDDENAAVKKLEEWMAAHSAQYGIKETQPPATRPAPEPLPPPPQFGPAQLKAMNLRAIAPAPVPPPPPATQP